MQCTWVYDHLGSKLLIHLSRIHYQGHLCVYDQMMDHFVLWKYGYGGLRLINSRSHGEVNEPSKAISIMNDEIVQETIVGHEFGVKMTNSCHISKTFVKEVQ